MNFIEGGGRHDVVSDADEGEFCSGERGIVKVAKKIVIGMFVGSDGCVGLTFVLIFVVGN